jgi:sugar phosphate permease
MILTGLFIYSIRFGSSGWPLIILLLLLGCVLFAIMPVISAAAIDYTIKGTEGTSVSLLFSGGAILGSLSPLISGYFYDSFGFNAVLTFTSVLALLGTVISLIAWNRFK